MKILKLKFRNINSLAGDWSVDFTQPDFRDGLFLLTGPTGSGKTTVLDAITLALYGKTARVDIKGKDNEVLTRNTGDCFSEVVFQTKDGVYTARWSQRRGVGRGKNKGGWGDLADLKMSLVAPGGKDISRHKNSDTKTLIEQTVGLSFEQFTRTVLLAQGHFDTFLSADETQRAFILEQATGTGIYSRIGARVNEECKKAERCVRDQEAKQGAVSVLSPEERAAKEAELAAGRRTERDLAPVVEALTQEKAWLEADAKLAVRADELATAEAALTKGKEEFAPDAARLDRADKAEKLASDFATLTGLRKRKETAEKAVSDRRSDLEETRAALPAAQTAADAAAQADSAAQTAYDVEQPRIRQARALLTKRAELSTALSAEKAAEKTARDALDGVHRRIQNARNALDAARARIQTLGSWTNPKADALAQARQAEADARAAASTADAAVVAAEGVFAAAEPGLLKAIAAAQKKRDAALKVRNLDEERAKLHDGDVCPLCLQVYHTLQEALPDEKAEEAQLKDCQDALEDAKKTVADAKDAASKAQRKTAAAQRALSGAQSAFDAAKAKHDTDLAASTATEAEQNRALAAAETELPAAQRALADCTQRAAAAQTALDQAMEDFRVLGIPADVDRYDRDIQAKRAAAAEKKSKTDAAFQAAKTAIAKAEAEYQTAQANASRAKDDLAKAESSFAGALAADGFADEAEWQGARWNPGDVAKARARRDALRDEESRLAGRRATLDQETRDHASAPGRSERALEDVAEELTAKAAEKARSHDHAEFVQYTLRTDNDNQKKLGTLQDELKRAKDVAGRWATLDKLLGGPEGGNFRRYVQYLTLQELIQFANPRLQAMSNRRYELFLAPEDMVPGARNREIGLLPDIVDHDQADEHRSLANLSGGERFQVSLSLALGLSEMASEGVSVESLFLDEGFGTLDGEALERAIDTLEGVQRDGCLLGVISHVAAVAERIRTQITVTKVGSGHSVLTGAGIARG